MNEVVANCRCPAWTLLRAVAKAGCYIVATVERHLEPTGLSVPKLRMLSHLVDAGGPLPLGQLAERSACAKSNVTQLVDRLEADGLVQRVPDPEDRRSVRAVITERGLEVYGDGMRAQAAAESELLQPFSTSEQAQLATLLEQFSSARVMQNA